MIEQSVRVMPGKFRVDKWRLLDASVRVTSSVSCATYVPTCYNEVR